MNKFFIFLNLNVSEFYFRDMNSFSGSFVFGSERWRERAESPLMLITSLPPFTSLRFEVEYHLMLIFSANNSVDV